MLNYIEKDLEMNTPHLIKKYLAQFNYCTARPVFIVKELYPVVFLLEEEARHYCAENRGRDYACCSISPDSVLHNILTEMTRTYLSYLNEDEIAQAKNIGIYPRDCY